MKKIIKRKLNGQYKKGFNGKIKTGKIRECLICGKKFYKRPYYDTVGKGKYCSIKCYRVSRRGKGKGSKGKFKKGDKRIMGMNNPNWNGGVSRKDFRKTEQYKDFIKSVLRRDKWTCQNCGKIGGRLHVHHLKSYALFPKLRIYEGNAVTLCEQCHKQTPDFLKNFRGSHKTKRVLLTGISGFISSALAEKLLEDGYEVAGIVRQSTRENEAIKKLKNKIKLYQANLLDYQSLKFVLRDFQPTFICHLGAITPVSYSFSHPVEVSNVNYIGTINLIEAALEEVPQLAKFIFSGSMEEYGLQEQQPFKEDLILHPLCPYAIAKVAAEKYLQYIYMTTGYPIVVFRQTNCYGRQENDYFVVEAIVTQMLKNKKEINLGNKEPIRNFIYINDLINLWQQVIQSDDVRLLGEVFNTGPNNGLTIEELAKKITKKLNWKGKINWNTRERRIGEVPYLNSLNDKISGILDWSPQISLDDGLNKIIKFWKNKLKK